MQVIIPLGTIFCLVSVKFAEPAPRIANSGDLAMETLSDANLEHTSQPSSWAEDDNKPPVYRHMCKMESKMHATSDAFGAPAYEFVPKAFKSTWCVELKGKTGMCNNGYGHCVTQYESREFARRPKNASSCEPWEKVQLKVATGCNCLAQI